MRFLGCAGSAERRQRPVAVERAGNGRVECVDERRHRERIVVERLTEHAELSCDADRYVEGSVGRVVLA